MILAAACIGCKEGHPDIHPVGWTRVRVNAATRLLDEPHDEKMIIQTDSKTFLFCKKCFEPWWSGEQVGQV